MRVASDRPIANGGWIHRLDAATTIASRPEENGPAPIAPAEIEILARRFQADLTEDRLLTASRILGVSRTALLRVRIGWSHGVRAYTFPMSDDRGRTVGFRTRTPMGRKRSIAGGREGLFIPIGVCVQEPIFCEGPTSLAALIDLGFAAVGRPSCNGGADLAMRWLRGLRVNAVTIFGDRDEKKERVKGDPTQGFFYPGQDGAREFARACAAAGIAARVVIPPVKDARAWLAAGATHADVLAEIRRGAVYAARRGRAA